MGGKFELIVAASREGPNKVYVQHRLREHAREVNELLQQPGYFYVCGDAANMAREVSAAVVQILAEQRGITEGKTEEVVKQMRSLRQYQVIPTLKTPYRDDTNGNAGRHLVTM